MNEPVRPALPISLLQALLRRLRLIPQTSRDVDAERMRAQVDVIRRAFKASRRPVASAPSEGIRTPEDDCDVHYLYRPGHALVRREDLERLERYFADEANRKRFRGKLEGRETRVPGLLLAELPSRTDEQDDVLATVAELEDEGVLERGAVTPDHVIYVSGYGWMCPATEPENTRSRRPWPPQAPYRGEIDAKDKVRVTVVDTGLWKPAVGSAETPWLESDDVFAGNDDEEHVNASAIHPYAGHGTFVAGIISCVAPETHIDVEGALPYGGAIYESELCEQLQDALEENQPQLISMSAGTHTRGGHPMLSFVLLAENNKFDENDDILVVAAAGNDGSNEVLWPAAFAWQFPWVVSVGSVDPDQKVSKFSNYGGDWVSVYARGRNVVNAFPKGTYTCYEPPNKGKVRTFDGLAQWSGTSFATPIVTGLIAAYMRDNPGVSARQAWNAVQKTAITVHDSRINEDIRIVGPLT